MCKRILSSFLSPSIAWVAIAFLLAGCVTAQYTDTIRAIDLSQANQKRITTTVLANAEAWRNSGVVVKASTTYHISAQGRWTAGGPCGWSGPDGIGASWLCGIGPFGSPIPVRGRTVNTLVAKVGSQGIPFAVGDTHRLIANIEGTLYFRMNDDLFGDNEGSVQVTTSLVRPESQQAVKQKPDSYEPDIEPAQTQALVSKAIGEKWAVIIGISQYQDTRVPSLRYPSADAQAFYEWVISPQGGRYAPSRVKLLIDEKATGKNIKSALFVWLKQALEEDMVTIYFAGHGSPESPDSPSNLFLLPYDTVYDDLSVTGFPMWDIETALKRFIKAKKVVVIADACHSGGIGQPFEVARRGNRDIQVNRINSGLQNLSQIGDGVAVINAADETQFSQESERWGGGHGVFTFFLVKGLKGEADYNRDGTVTLGELIPFLSEKVRRETRNAQSPTVAGRFDPALTIAR